MAYYWIRTYRRNEEENKESKRKVIRVSSRRRNIPELDVDETERKSIDAKLQYILSDYPSLVEKACRNEKGQKSLIKQLWSDHEEVVEKCDIIVLRHALWESSFLSCLEGIRFCAYSVRKIGIRSSFLLMKKMVLNDASVATCNHLGQVVYNSWLMAIKEEDNELLKEIETEMITGTVHAALMMPMNLSKKFLHILSAFSGPNVNKAKADGTLSCNDYVRYAASSILLGFYPLIDDDDFVRSDCLYKQHTIMMSMLKDDCTAIRTIAAKKIVDTLSRDTVVGVRLAVYEGMRYLITVPACLNATEHALKCITLNGINDKNERVRVAAFEMLSMLKGHRYIRFFDVVPMEEILARLQVETSESVRREIVPVIFKSFFPDRGRADQNERMRRIAFLIKHGRICALTFHRLVFTLGLVTVKDAVEHIQFMTILVYRSFSKGMSEDPTMDGTAQLDDTVGTLSDPTQEIAVPDENNQVWKRNKVFLECVVVMWMSMRKVLMESKYALEKQKLDNLETKVFKKLFQCFRSTSLIGTTMLIGSLLPSSCMDSITQSVLSLLNEKVVDDCVMEPYLEATAQWRIEHLFEIINSGLSILETEIYTTTCSPLTKRRNAPELHPVDRLQKSLRYLKYLLRSYSTNQMITCIHVFQLEQFYKKLANIQHVIGLRVGNEVVDVGIPDKLIIDAFEMKQTLAAVLLNCKDRGENDAEHIARFVKDMCDELTWFDSSVLSSMAALDSNDTIPFLTKLSETVLRNIGLTLAAFDFSEVHKPDNSTQSLANVLHVYPEIASRLVLSFCNSTTPGLLLPPVLTAARQLLANENTDFSHLVTVLDFIPKWIINCEKYGDDLDEKATADAYLALWKTFLEGTDYTETMLDRSINVCAVLLLNYLTQLNEDLIVELSVTVNFQAHDVPDPRMLDYEMTSPISIILQRVLFKSKILITFCKYFSVIRRTSEYVTNLLVNLRDRVETVAKENPPNDDMILSQLREMFN
uniref:Condensin complex subunit 1 n=1 Tax=Angiostrongylus cantonensis TaxID=6313 RepID=A0A158PAE8_ANGCA